MNNNIPTRLFSLWLTRVENDTKIEKKNETEFETNLISLSLPTGRIFITKCYKSDTPYKKRLEKEEYYKKILSFSSLFFFSSIVNRKRYPSEIYEKDGFRKNNIFFTVIPVLEESQEMNRRTSNTLPCSMFERERFAVGDRIEILFSMSIVKVSMKSLVLQPLTIKFGSLGFYFNQWFSKMNFTSKTLNLAIKSRRNNNVFLFSGNICISYRSVVND